MPKKFGHKKKPVKRKILDKPKNGSRQHPAPHRRVDENLVKGTSTVENNELSDDEKSQSELAIRRNKGRGDQAGLLTSDDPKELLKDVKTIDRALRNRWGVRRKDMIRQRLEDIVAKETAKVATKQGKDIVLEDSETKADELAIQAAKVLVQMDGIDQKDEHKEVYGNKPDAPGLNVYGNININNDADERRTRLLELAKRFGASELVIDGSKVEPGETSDSAATGELSGHSEEAESGFSFITNKAAPKTD